MLPLIALLTAPTLQAPAPQPFAGLAFLEGRWIGEGFQAGASGEFSLEKALDGRILLRKNLARIPGADGKLAVYEDLMVIFGEPGPRFRLSYLRSGEDSLEIRFEIAPPNKPEQFKVYQSGKARRVKP